MAFFDYENYVDMTQEKCMSTEKGYLTCPNMVSSYEGFEGERYRCEKCGKSVWVDYEDCK